jgi:1,2-diacylglycerol 3-beta-galactosyltransferase
MTQMSAESCPRVLFLFSDTGGGHRSATEAIIEAMQLDFGDRICPEMVDFFKEYAPQPFDRMPQWYPYMVKVPEMWGLGFHLSDNPRSVRIINDAAWPYIRSATRNFVSRVDHDMIVSVHPVVNTPILRAMGARKKIPYVTVVTDMVTTHAMWFNRRVDLCIVPTEAARQRAIQHGMPSERMQVVGMPVAQRFCLPPSDPQPLRARLGWPQDRPIILLVGGGEGMGPIEQNAIAIADAALADGLRTALVIIAGRNEELKARLEARTWPIPTFVYGFVREMPDFMRAVDMIVTKAGPGTISEAFNAGLPIVLYSRLPGQEDGNVTYVVNEGAGVWAPTTEQVMTALREWLIFPDKRLAASQASRRVARPQAARQIARLIAAQLGVYPEPPSII